MRPLLNYDFCKNNRDNLFKLLPDNSVVILESAKNTIRNSDVTFGFRQDSNFWYLTGFDEPDAVLVLQKKATQQTAGIFINEKNIAEEIWNGFRLGTQAAAKILQLDFAIDNKKIDASMPSLLKDYANIYTNLDADWLAKIAKWRNASGVGRNSDAMANAICDLNQPMAHLRLRKSDYEIDLMQKAADISAQAHQKAMEFCAKNHKADIFEYQLQGLLESDFIFAGAGGLAYSSIVAAGSNACVLHYVENNAKISPQDLVLIDAGCEYAGYASDITRSFPASGKFTEPQAQIYQLVLGANKLGIELSKPNTTLAYIHTQVVRFITQGLLDLGILYGELEDLILQKKYYQFFMHGTSHWLGLDVHDLGAYKTQGEDIVLQAGMAFTIEPGLYFLPQAGLDEKWHNIGIRIEDDIVITPTSCKVLTKNLAKEIDEIEALMARAAKEL